MSNKNSGFRLELITADKSQSTISNYFSNTVPPVSTVDWFVRIHASRHRSTKEYQSSNHKYIRDLRPGVVKMTNAVFKYSFQHNLTAKAVTLRDSLSETLSILSNRQIILKQKPQL